jgi:hypothetical protein
VIVAHVIKREVEPGQWVPVRPLRGSLLARRGARRHCAVWGHCHHPANTAYPVAYCCYCGRARHLLDRVMGR